MYVYRNSNTGRCVTLQQRSVRLDHLPNWLLIDAPEEPTPEPVTVPVPAAAPEQVSPDSVAATMPRPRDTDVKAAWIAYAVSRGMPEKDAKALSKASLMQEFGEENANGED